MSEGQPDDSLDARGRRCSMLSMMVAERISPLSPGAVLEVLTDDPGAPTEMPAWCRRTGHELVGLEPMGEEFRLRIRRSG
jgi:tRNA 2-thiouridine synthesizing protein A